MNHVALPVLQSRMKEKISHNKDIKHKAKETENTGQNRKQD